MVKATTVLSLLATATSTVARQASPGAAPPGTDVIPGAYIVEFEEGQDTKPLRDAIGVDGDTRLELDYELFKGVSIQLKDTDDEKAEAKASKLASMPAVKALYPVHKIPRPNPKIEWVATAEDVENASLGQDTLVSRADGEGEVDKFSSHVMTQVDKLRAKGIRGKGIKIAVVDSGIDYTHPALGNNCFGEGCLVSFGTDYVGDDYTGANTPNPDNDPMDCGGHGTHVAGIIAAQENPFGFTGAAPDVTLGAYRVFGCEGYTSSDLLIASFNQAYQDGAQIISSSIGGPSGWSDIPWAVASSRIAEKGVPVIISAGNEGTTGIFYASSGSSGDGVAAIASYDNTNRPTVFTLFNYTVDDGDRQEFGMVPSTPADWAGVSLPLWALNYDTTVADDGCKPFPADTPDLKDKIVLIRRGGCNFVVKGANAVAKGAKYVIIYNNARPGAGGIDFNDPEPTGVEAGGMVEADQGEEWIKELKAGKEVKLYMANPNTKPKRIQDGENLATPGALSYYTTWGPTWDMKMKPQYGAPGGFILSTYPLAKGGYAVLSGTSMACPITSAVTALIAEVRGTFDPVTITNLLAANSNPQLFHTGSKFIENLAPIAQQGAGMIQAYDAAYATTLLEPAGLSFNDTAHFVKSSTIKLSNTGKEEVTYELSHNPAMTFYTLGEDSPYVPPFPNDAVDVYAKLGFSENKVTIPAGGSASIEVTPTPPEGLNPKRLGVWGGYVVINGTDGTSLSMPYQGLTGSLNEHIVLEDDATWISKSTDKTLSPLPANTSFIIPPPGRATADDELPQFVIDLALGSHNVVAHIQPMTTCPPKNTFQVSGYKSIGMPAGFPALWNSRGIINAVWDGQLSDGNYAPPGKYRLVVWALRIFGDPNNEDDWDVSVSPGFKIKYV